jgi:hypothetical protein
MQLTDREEPKMKPSPPATLQVIMLDYPGVRVCAV